MEREGVERLLEGVIEPGMEMEMEILGAHYFQPTEFELIEEFLKKKITRHPLPNDTIKELPFLYEYPPEILPLWKFKYGRDNEAFYFTHKGKKPPHGELLGGKKFNGQWKTDGPDEAVFTDSKTLGFKRKLYFYRGEVPRERKTGWVITEYRLNPKRVPVQFLQNSAICDLIENYVVLKVKFKPALRENFSAKEAFSISMEEAKDLDFFDDFEN